MDFLYENMIVCDFVYVDNKVWKNVKKLVLCCRLMVIKE